MVRPEVTVSEPARAGEVVVTRCTDVVGASPTPVSAEAPGSRLPEEGETRPTEAQRQKPLMEGANEQAVTLVEEQDEAVSRPA